LAAFAAALVMGACAPSAWSQSGRITGLPTERVRIVTQKGAHDFVVEIAADDPSRQQGLMYRKKMAADRGMIFEFFQPQPLQFWMHNTRIPLDIIFVGQDGRIRTIVKMAKPFDDTSVPRSGPVTARAVVEINGGLSDKLGIREGDLVQDEVVFRTLPR
jgi:uncharacterized membrane protein (UPF0127 family)